MSDYDLLDEKVIYQHGPWQRVRRWWRGAHAEKGTITTGLTGCETIEEKDRILALHRFVVTDKKAA